MNHQLPRARQFITISYCSFAKDFSHKKREPVGSLFLCVVVMGGIEPPTYGL